MQAHVRYAGATFNRSAFVHHVPSAYGSFEPRLQTYATGPDFALSTNAGLVHTVQDVREQVF